MDRTLLPARPAAARALALASALLFGLSACAGDEAGNANARGARAPQDADLPAPERTSGSVTGMPDDPGPGTTPLQSVGGVTGEAAGVASIEPGIEPPTGEVPEPAIAFEPGTIEVPPIDVVPVDPRTGNALPAVDPEATASTTIVVDVPVEGAPATGETGD